MDGETTYRGPFSAPGSEGAVVRRGQIIGTVGPGSSNQTGRLRLKSATEILPWSPGCIYRDGAFRRAGELDP